MDFEHETTSFFNKIGIAKKMVLATCAENKTTARMMSCIFTDGNIYFQTDKDFLKYKQITINPNVALCIDNIQIEGIASDIGHPLDKDNIFFSVKFKASFRGAYYKYTSLSCERLIQVTPKFITLWEYDNGKPYRIFYDFAKREVHKEYYKCCAE